MPVMEEALAEFLLACEADGLKSTTVAWYKSLLRLAVAHFQQREIAHITTHELRQYIAALRKRAPFDGAPQRPTVKSILSEDTISAYINSLHRFFAWCSREYSIENPMRHIKRPAKTKAAPKAITPADMQKLFMATGKDIAGIRDRAIIAFLADTGCRSEGLRKLHVSDLDMTLNRAYIAEKSTDTRAVIFTTFTAELLRDWLRERPAQIPHVFYNLRTFEPLTRSGLLQLLERLKDKAGVFGRVNPHAFRHGFAREYLKAGGDLATLATLMGHKDISTTTSYYAVFDDNELAERHERFSPVNNLKGDSEK